VRITCVTMDCLNLFPVVASNDPNAVSFRVVFFIFYSFIVFEFSLILVLLVYFFPILMWISFISTVAMRRAARRRNTLAHCVNTNTTECISILSWRGDGIKGREETPTLSQCSRKRSVDYNF